MGLIGDFCLYLACGIMGGLLVILAVLLFVEFFRFVRFVVEQDHENR